MGRDAAERGRPLRMLFVCTGNSCRSQMAAGWATALKRGVIDADSAGTNPAGLNTLAVRAMREVGIDISGRRSKSMAELSGERFDVAVTVCDEAHESCPIVPMAARVHHRAFDDPPRLAAAARDEEEAMGHYRRVRDEIGAWVRSLPGSIDERAGCCESGSRQLRKEQAMGNQTGTNGKCCDDGCCGGANNAVDHAELVRETVRAGYGKIAESGAWSSVQAAPASGGCCGGGGGGGGGCCGPTTLSAEQVAAAVGYGKDELSSLPEGANLGLSCGNPTALASLKPGEVVLDLGSGAGFDCFIAGPKVGAQGRVIGVDMTPEMLSRARKSLGTYRASSGLDNVEFRLGEIENLPVADASADVVISNCVLNLSPDKGRVWKEIARVLKPGGRVAVSDLALLKPLPESVQADVEALVGCVAGAVLVEDTREQMQAAGLSDIKLTPKPEYIEAMTDWRDPLYRRILGALPAGSKVSDYITSLDIAARRAGGPSCCSR